MELIGSDRAVDRTLKRLSRRKMLTTIGSTTVGFLLVSASAEGAKPKTLGPGDLTKTLFDPRVGTIFTVQTGTTAVSLTLVTVEGRAKSTQKFKISRQPFTLTFSAPPGVNLADGVYSLTHPTLGQIAGVFISAVGRRSDSKGSLYQAVFS